VRETIYKNLEAEIKRLDISRVDFTRSTGISAQSLYRVLKGDSNITLVNSFKVRDYLNSKTDEQDYTVDYLFKTGG
jgi:predicted transcriptional regulator